HNTAFQTGNIVFGGDHAAHTGFVFQNNIVLEHEHGIIGSGTEVGIPTLARYFPNAVVRRNVIVGGSPSRYPADNLFAASLSDVGFTADHDGTRRLTIARRYAKAGTDGR